MKTEYINLKHFFQNSQNYVILRMSEKFPLYSKKSDIDILCSNRDKFIENVLEIGKIYFDNGFSFKVTPGKKSIHIDFLEENTDTLNLRFDITEKIEYKNFNISEKFTLNVLNSARLVNRDNLKIYVPSLDHDLAIRFFEYYEFKDTRKDKIKHIDYILKRKSKNFINVILEYSNIKLEEINAYLGASDKYNKSQIINETQEIQERLDFFMIWGHGIKHKTEIINTIRDIEEFEIIKIVKKQISNIEDFVQNVYSCDTFPIQHLIAKTRYLLNTPPEIIFILIKNRKPKIAWRGDGEFKRCQCMLIKEVKEKIRDKFNPKENNQRTEHHVIHASDYESQVSHILNILQLNDISYYKRTPHPEINAPHHVDDFTDYFTVNVKIDDLRANIIQKGLAKIEETPHYQYLLGNKKIYQDYYNENFGDKLTEDHAPEAFDRLLRNFEYEPKTKSKRKNIILTYPINNKEYCIVDGVHRAAILKSQNKEIIKIAVIKNYRKHTQLEVLSKENHSRLKPVVTMSSLGSYGRFGNQFFQYIFLKMYSEKYNTSIQTPKWIGQELFGITDKSIDRRLPQIELPNSSIPCWEDPSLIKHMPLLNVDLKGYFHYHTKYMKNCKKQIISLFQPIQKIKSYLQPIFENIKKNNRTLIGIHLRNGDFGKDHHFITPNSWYKQWLNTVWKNVTNPILYIASDNIHNNINYYKEYKPISYLDFYQEKFNLEFYFDFYMLSQCDILAISNSTFSFAASMLNNNGYNFVRPRLSQKKLIQYDPWNSLPEFKDEKVEDFKNTLRLRKKPKISVLMSAYNAEKYIKLAIFSILKQSYKNFEIIIIDDKSEDNTKMVINSIYDEKIKLIENKENLGLTKSLNIGLSFCEGEYIARMDADDISLENRFEIQNNFLDINTDISVIGSSYLKIDKNNNVLDVINVPLKDQDIKSWLNYKCPFGHGTVMMRRSALEYVGGYDENFLYAQDYDLWLRLSKNFKLANIDQPLYCWRLTNECISHSKYKEQQYFHRKAIQNFNNIF